MLRLRYTIMHWPFGVAGVASANGLGVAFSVSLVQLILSFHFSS